MRVIGGALKGRTIKTPRGQQTRPTADRVRESIFQVLETRWLEDGFSDRLVLDLYAGSGAMGIEALSRGAGYVIFFESSQRAAGVIQRNLTELGITTDRFELVTRPLPSSLTRHGKQVRESFHGVGSVIFSDPPYDDDLQDELGPLLRDHPAVAPDAIWCHECSGDRQLNVDPWNQRDRRDYGDTTIRLMFGAEPRSTF